MPPLLVERTGFTPWMSVFRYCLDTILECGSLLPLSVDALSKAEENRHRGSGRPLAPATPPDMRVRIWRFRGLRKAIEQPRKTERVEVGERKRDGQGRAVRHTPRAVRTTRRLCSEFLTNPALA